MDPCRYFRNTFSLSNLIFLLVGRCVDCALLILMNVGPSVCDTEAGLETTKATKPPVRRRARFGR